jgi:LPS export ABC transporter protein LptC
LQEIRRKELVLDIRARLPQIARAVSLIIFLTGLVYVGVSYYKQRNNRPFRMHSGSPALSKQVVGVVNGYERRENKGDKLWLLLRADKDITFSDGHHELEKVTLEIYQSEESRPDRITADRSITDETLNKITFSGSVNIETHDSLTAQTEVVEFDREKEIAEAHSAVEFRRENVHGTSRGFRINAGRKQIELLDSVAVNISDSSDTSTASDPVLIRSKSAFFDNASRRLSFRGGATVEQKDELMSGEIITAILSEQKRLRQIEARSKSLLRTLKPGHAAELTADEIDFHMNEKQQLDRAVARSHVSARTIDADSELTMSGTQAEAQFITKDSTSVINQLTIEGRPLISMSAPRSRANDPQSASKRLTADSVKLHWLPSGKDLNRVEAIGKAELLVEPIHRSPELDKKRLYADRFDCSFYEAGNLARLFTATGSARAIIEPVEPSQTRATRTLNSQKITSSFTKETQDVDVLTASGEAKFNEEDRNGRASTITYTRADQFVRMRGGEPVVWDSRARTKATEIDVDTANEISYGRTKTSTTYYNQQQTGGAAPFSNVKSPVFIVSENSEFNHRTGVAIYRGNARTWQDDNFVKADTITLRRETKVMESDGNVQAGLYNLSRKDEKGARQVVPAFASSNRMVYSDSDRVLHFRGDVDIKQGTDRLLGEVANVYLHRETNEVEKTIVEKSVVVTQPGRKGTGDWAQYTAMDETIVLKGNPARVEDSEQGVSESRRLTVNLRQSHVVADIGGPQATGRIRSTHRIKKKID